MSVLARRVSWILIAVVWASVLGLVGPASGALQKPSYSPGDRWVFVLDGSLSAVPGINATDGGEFRFDLVGRVDVEVVGTAGLPRPTGIVPTVEVDTRTTGFLNGSFSFPGVPGAAKVTGSFTSSTSEFWETAGLFSVESRGHTSYTAEVTFLITTTPLTIDLRLDTTTTIAPIPAFDLDVGERAMANLTTLLRANSTVTFLGDTQRLDNETEVSSEWHREVLAAESVTVEAGSFATYRLNQSLGTFPGLPAATGGNETAYFSNDVGFYVKRVAYENDTPVSEMRLKSYSYAAGPQMSGGGPLVLLLVIAVPAALAFVAVVLWRRRAVRHRSPENPGPIPNPPTDEGRGGGDAR